MSEFHPNRDSKVKTKLGLTRRKIFESWPLLVWAGVVAIAFWGYSRGHIFSRMNGAVDVYQENISPAEEGRVVKILKKRGDFVEPGATIAIMDSSEYERELTGILRGVAANRYQEIARLERQQLDLEAEQRKLEISQSESEGRLVGLKAAITLANAAGKATSYSGWTADKLAALATDIGEIEGSKMTVDKSLKKVSKSLEDLIEQISKLKTTATATAIATGATLSDEIRAGLLPDEQKDVTELLSLIERCSLKTTRGGVIDRLEKEEGEFVAKGQSVMRVVAEPEQIVAFLPHDQVGKLTVGDPVWITPAMDRNSIFEAIVTAISPRMNNLADSTSPLPNRRIFGRDVVISFPKAALPPSPGQAGLLIPGQTVTVHIKRPGDIPLMNRIFHNDEAD